MRRNSRTLRAFLYAMRAALSLRTFAHTLYKILYAMRAALSGEGRRKRALPHFTG
jgi:hypothetical protein